MTAATQPASTDDDAPVESGGRAARKPPAKSVAEAKALDYLRYIWKGEDGLQFPPDAVWLDREARVLTVLIHHERAMCVAGYELKYLLGKARLSRSDWFRALRLLKQEGVVGLDEDNKRRNPKTGKVRRLVTKYRLHPTVLLSWVGKARPAHWPTDARPKSEESAPGAGAYELALEEARVAAGLSPEDVAVELVEVRKADAEARRLTATVERVNRELKRIAARQRAFEAARGAKATETIAALRTRAGLAAEPIFAGLGAPEPSDQPETTPESGTHQGATVAPGAAVAEAVQGATVVPAPGVDGPFAPLAASPQGTATASVEPTAVPAPASAALMRRPTFDMAPAPPAVPRPAAGGAPPIVVRLPARPLAPVRPPLREDDRALVEFAERIAPTNGYAANVARHARDRGHLTQGPTGERVRLEEMMGEHARKAAGPGTAKTDPMRTGLQPEAGPGQYDWRTQPRHVLRFGGGEEQ